MFFLSHHLQHCFFIPCWCSCIGLVQFPKDLCFAIDLLYQYIVYQFAFNDEMQACMWYAKPVSCFNMCFCSCIRTFGRCNRYGNMMLGHCREGGRKNGRAEHLAWVDSFSIWKFPISIISEQCRTKSRTTFWLKRIPFEVDTE